MKVPVKVPERYRGPAEPGDLVPGQGVFVGCYAFTNKAGLTKTFNIYAAPQDLTDAHGVKMLDYYPPMAERVGQLKNWHGADGVHYDSDKEFYQGLEDGSYKGQWIVPPREILYGRSLGGEYVQPDNLMAHRSTGAFKDTFNEPGPPTPNSLFHWYWSSTLDPECNTRAFNASFRYGSAEWTGHYAWRHSCRPVRLVPVS